MITKVSAAPITALAPQVAPPASASAPEAEPGPVLPPAPRLPAASVGEAIAMLVIEASFERRDAARELRGANTAALGQAQRAELAHLREAAEKRYDASMMKAGFQIAGGVVSLGGLAAAPAGAAMRNAPLNTVGSVLQNGAVSAVLDGTGTALSAGATRAADRHDASAKSCEHAARALRDVNEDTRADLEASRESVRKALDFLREFERTQAQTVAAALHRA